MVNCFTKLLDYYNNLKNKKLIHQAELIIEKIVPYALILLFILLAFEIFFKEIAEQYLSSIRIIDYSITIILVLDLIFKFIYSSTTKSFVKRNWLDVIAILPFMLLFRVFEELMIFIKIGEKLVQVE